jgi:hypothetical protein
VDKDIKCLVRLTFEEGADSMTELDGFTLDEIKCSEDTLGSLDDPEDSFEFESNGYGHFNMRLAVWR